MISLNKINKKGLSDVVSIVLFLALVVVMVGVVWGVVNNLVQDRLEESGSCFDTFGKVTINGRYTCYNSTSNELRLSLSLGDLDPGAVIVGISAEGTSISFNIGKTSSQIANLRSYPDYNLNTSLPGQNGGKTYVLNMTAAGFSSSPDSIRIAPIVGGDQCETSDSLDQIDSCLSLVS